MNANNKIRKIHPTDPQPDVIDEAAAVILDGGVVAFPTRGLYGLGADAFNESAVRLIFDIKKRPKDKPILLLVDSPADLPALVKDVPAAAQQLMAQFWPGHVTIVFKASEKVPRILTGGTGRIGIRAAGHPVATELVRRVGRPITGTSANISGQDNARCSPEVNSVIGQKVDLILDAGPLQGGAGSTVVDVTQDPPEILREGSVQASDIFKLF